VIDVVAAGLLASSAVSAAALVAVGRYVATAPPAHLDARTQRIWFARFTPLARFFTDCGYSRGILVAFTIAGAITAAWQPLHLWKLLALFAAQAVSQSICNALKARFGRVRPQDWLYRQETNEAFPSGHASTAVVTYGGIFALFMIETNEPAVRIACVIALLVFVFGIGWSRIALGAHYFSDVIAGYLVGFATLCCIIALSRLLAPHLVAACLLARTVWYQSDVLVR
jgi:undecaprenyl-diphosphatase